MIESVVLDICKHPNVATQTITLRQGELASTTLNIDIYEDGESFDLSEYEVQFMAALLNGKVIIDPCTKLGANSVTYTLPPALVKQAGTVNLAYLAISKNNEWIATTDCMTFLVKQGVDIKAEEAQNILGHFTTLKKQLDELIDIASEQTSNQQTSWEEQMQNQASAFEAAEALRDEQEEERVIAETQRAEAEAERQTAEADRQTNETSRQEAENQRVMAELERVAAEQFRVKNEEIRIEAESNRVTAEAERVAAEESRNSAEEIRIDAEAERVAAEAKRQAEIDEVLASIQIQNRITEEEIAEMWESGTSESNPTVSNSSITDEEIDVLWEIS